MGLLQPNRLRLSNDGGRLCNLSDKRQDRCGDDFRMIQLQPMAFGLNKPMMNIGPQPIQRAVNISGGHRKNEHRAEIGIKRKLGVPCAAKAVAKPARAGGPTSAASANTWLRT